MAQPEHEELARRLLKRAEEMLALAEQGEWTLLAQREQERQELASDLFANPVPREAASTVAECVREVLTIDQKLLALVDQRKEEAVQALREAEVGKKALDAYRRFSR